MAGFLDIVTPVTIANYALGATESASVHNPGFKMMREAADWEHDVGGVNATWQAEVGYDKPIISAPGMDLTGQLRSTNRHVQASLNWGEIAGVKTVDNGALRRNSGKAALVKLRDKEIPAMLLGILLRADGFWSQFLNQNISSPTQADGNTVTGLPMAGLPSALLAPGTSGLLGYNGLSTYTGLVVAATDKEAVPPAASTYGGLSMGNAGLSGIDNLQNDAWTPTLVNTVSTAWNGVASASGAIHLWLQHLANRMRRFSSGDPSQRPDPMRSGWMSFDHFQALSAYIATKQGIYLQGKAGAETQVAGLGTDGDALPHAGMLWRWDERMPAACTYVIPWAQVQILMQTLYAGIEGPGNPLGKSGEDAGLIETAITYDPVRRQWIVTGTLPGQIVLKSPRYFGRAGAYA